MLNFTTQKNGLTIKKIGHKASGNPLLCPKSALLWRVLHLRANNVTPFNPIYHVMTPTGQWKNTTTAIISKTFKTSVMFCGPNLVFETKDVYDYSLCSASAMSILCDGVDSDIIKLIGCWCSNEMICYLNIQVKLIMRNFSQLMLTHGNYSLLHQQEAIRL